MPSTASQDLVHGGAGVGAQVEPFGDLDRVWCALLAAFGVCTGSVADDNFHPSMTAEPIGEHLGVALVEQSLGGVKGVEAVEFHGDLVDQAQAGPQSSAPTATPRFNRTTGVSCMRCSALYRFAISGQSDGSAESACTAAIAAWSW
jgi:hypothetical protein